MPPRDQSVGRAFQGSIEDAGQLAAALARAAEYPSLVVYAEHPLRAGAAGLFIGKATPAAGTFDLGEWRSGRVFCPALEIRWHVEPDGVSLLLLIEAGVLPKDVAEICPWEAAEEYRTRPMRHLLSGVAYRRGDRTFFAEAAVPRIFAYPVQAAHGSRAVLHGRYYTQSVRTVLTRFTHFAVEGGQ